MFKGIVINKDEKGYRAALESIDDSALPEGDVTVRVEYSTINYKDALAITGKGKIARSFPMVPGIDFTGEVLESSAPGYKPGDRVLLNGWGVGEKHWGGLADKARVRGDWLIPLPQGMTGREAMVIGTAGYTAMLCVMTLEAHGITPEKGEILVTGATGGVGSFAVAILSREGYRVTAMTGRRESESYLRELGAADIIDRSEYAEQGRPLAKERWAGVVDVAGGHTLANACAATRYGGVVTACGLADSMDFPATVAPFILRGVTLAGVESSMCPPEKRLTAWKRLAALELNDGMFNAVSREVPLDRAIEMSEALLEGKVRGRVIVKVS